MGLRRRPADLAPPTEDPLAYAEETRRLAAALPEYIFPPWRWPEWYRRRRIVQQRLAYLRARAAQSPIGNEAGPSDSDTAERENPEPGA